jgi:hypothetical protein
VDDDRDTVPDRDATSEGLGGFEFEVRYDPAILVLREIVATDFLGTFEVVCIVRDVDSAFQPGHAPIGCVRVGSDPGPQGSGAIATLKFRPLAPGTTQLELFGARLAGPLGEDIPISTEHASISVEYAEDHTAAVRIKPSDFRVSEDVPLFAVTIEVADLTHYGLLPVDGDRDGTVDFHRLSDGLGAFDSRSITTHPSWSL